MTRIRPIDPLRTGPSAALLLLALVLLFGGPAAAREPGSPAGASDPLFGEQVDDPAPIYPDPIEPVNRGVLRFNVQFDRFVLDPITRAYRFVLPDPVERGVRRFFLNLGEPAVLVNDMLQLEWRDAGVSGSRFLINSTVGVAGLFDPAARWGLERHESDFGQTLALADLPSGPYLILPIFGPTTVRDGTGVVTDTFFNPATYFFGFAFAQQLVFGGSEGLATRAAHYEALRALKTSSVDFYAALRSAYAQDRVATVWSRREHRLDDWRPPVVAY